jgi:hypothetical protein
MLRKFSLTVGLLVVLMASVYLLLPSPDFPPPPSGVLISREPADTESTFRRSYYSNYSRSELMNYYSSMFGVSPFRRFPLPQFRLNYPPEESQTLIRDQTRTSWLEELVHPWRESIYINGYYPTRPTEQININGVHYLNKVTVRYIPSTPVTRLTVLFMTVICAYWLIKEYAKI